MVRHHIVNVKKISPSNLVYCPVRPVLDFFHFYLFLRKKKRILKTLLKCFVNLSLNVLMEKALI